MDYLFLTANDNVYYSTDNGQSFDCIEDDHNFAKSILHVGVDDFLYAAVKQFLFKSTLSTNVEDNITKEDKRLKVYPIPAHNYLQLDISSKNIQSSNCTIYVYNKIGQIVFFDEIHPEQTSYSINTSDWQNGIFVMELICDKKTYSTKFIIH